MKTVNEAPKSFHRLLPVASINYMLYGSAAVTLSVPH